MDPLVEKTSFPLRRIVVGAVSVWIIAGLVGGCAPKRIRPSQGEPASAGPRKRLSRTAPPPIESTRPAPQQGHAETAEPDRRSSAGRPGYRTSPESVSLGLEAASLARAQLGKMYQWGAAGPDRFDCSGLTYYVFGQLGVALPRVSRDQASKGRQVGRSELQAGDLVFFATEGARINHVGIYLGNGEFVHAPRRHMPVRIDSLNDSWWRHRFRVARRLR